MSAEPKPNKGHRQFTSPLLLARAPGSNDNEWSRQASLALSPDGTPYVAWVNDNGYYAEIYIRRWNGTVWEEVGTGSATGGGISQNVGLSFYPSLAIAPDGTPYVAWQVYNPGSTQIYILRWNGNVWEEVGAGSASGGGISNSSGNAHYPSLKIASDGTLYVAWFDDQSGNPEIYVMHWNGSVWEEVGEGSASGGGISNTPGYSTYHAMALAPNGEVYVAWSDDSSNKDEIYLRRWNGTAWEEVGTGSATGGGLSNLAAYSARPSVAVASDGTPYIAWYSENASLAEIRVHTWNGTTWENIPTTISMNVDTCCHTGWPGYLTIALAPNDTPYLTWNQDNDGLDYEINILRWNGAEWEEVGPGSASGGGISNNSGASTMPAIAFSANGTPYVAWEDWSNGSVGEIYVLRYPK